MLVLLLEDSAQGLLEHAGDGEGLLSWRSLVVEQKLATAGKEVLAQTFKGKVLRSLDEVEVKIRRSYRTCGEVQCDRGKIAASRRPL